MNLKEFFEKSHSGTRVFDYKNKKEIVVLSNTKCKEYIVEMFYAETDNLIYVFVSKEG